MAIRRVNNGWTREDIDARSADLEALVAPADVDEIGRPLADVERASGATVVPMRQPIVAAPFDPKQALVVLQEAAKAEKALADAEQALSAAQAARDAAQTKVLEQRAKVAAFTAPITTRA